MRRAFGGLASSILIAVVALPVVIVALSLQHEPYVRQNASILFRNVEEIKALKERYDPRRMTPGVTRDVSATDEDLNSVLAAGLSVFNRVKGRIDIMDSKVRFATTVDLPIPEIPFGHYVNFKATIESSVDGLVFSSVSVGRLPVPSVLVKPVLGFAIDLLLGSGKGKVMIGSVRSVRVAGNTVTVAFRPPATFVADAKTAARRAVEVAGVSTIRVYYKRLVEVGQSFGYERDVSLASFIGPAFDLAHDRSALHDPIEENRALILALAVYFGDSQFARLLDEVKTGDLEGVEPKIDHVKIENRNDWVQHFITSAGLTVAGGTAFANILGEAKEVSDTQNSEGFSFGDLAADHTGVRLGVIATASPESALNLQRVLAGSPEEEDFFPPIADLPEDLDESEFKQVYGDVNSPTYLALVREIDRRIAQIPLYR